MANLEQQASLLAAHSPIRWLRNEFQASFIQAEAALDSFKVTGESEELEDLNAAIAASRGAAAMAGLPLLEQCCTAILEIAARLGQQDRREQAIVASLTQALQQLPAALDNSDHGKAVLQMVATTVELRAAAGEVSDCSNLFDVDCLNGWVKAQNKAQSHAERRRLLMVFQQAWQKLARGEEPAKQLAYLFKVAERLQSIEPEASFWPLLNSALDGVRRRQLRLSRGVSRFLTEVSRLATGAEPDEALFSTAAFWVMQRGMVHWPEAVALPDFRRSSFDYHIEPEIYPLVASLDLGQFAMQSGAVRSALSNVKNELAEAVVDEWQSEPISQSAEALQQAATVFRNCEAEALADLCDLASAFVTQHLMNAELAPSWSRIDALIDLLVGLDYFAEQSGPTLCPYQLQGLSIALEGRDLLSLDTEPVKPAAADEEAAASETTAAIAAPTDSDSTDSDAGPQPQTPLSTLAEDHDAEILGIFLEEAEDLLPEISAGFARWQSDGDEEALAELKRHTHTLKGGARMAGLPGLGDYAHALEDWMEGVIESFAAASEPEQSELSAEFKAAFAAAEQRLLNAFDAIRNPEQAASTGETAAAVSFSSDAEQPAPVDSSESLRVRTALIDDLVQKSLDNSAALSASASVLSALRQSLQAASNAGESPADALQEATAQLEQLAELQARQREQANTLQAGLLDLRTVPVSRLMPRLKRMVSGIASELGKAVDFKVYTANIELDKRVLDSLTPAFEHLLRNAIDHGLESPQLRRDKNKPETGSIEMRFSRDGNEVLITLEDDGGGINLDAVRSKAISKGMLAEGDNADDQALLDIIFQPGFSTAAAVSQVSGRGVGMDAVRSEIRQLGGNISAETGIHPQGSSAGGTRFSLRVPFTMAGNEAVLLTVGDQLWAVPFYEVDGVLNLSRWELEEYYHDQSAVLESGGQQYQLKYLGELLGLSDAPQWPEEGEVNRPVLLVHGVQPPIAVQVDALQGQQDILVKALPAMLHTGPGYHGSSVLGTGEIAVVLDLPALIDRQRYAQAKEQSPAPLAMVVDDSSTARTLARRLLEKLGYQVREAEHGEAALQALNAMVDKPEVILLDIDMPVMNGYRTAEALRQIPDLAAIPICVASSRNDQEHRDKLVELGIKSALVKPYHQEALQTALQTLASH